jgi:hypothetical protein
MAQFALVLSPANGNEPQVDLTCAISGDNDRWQGKTKRFTNREQAEKALRSAGVLRDRVSDERLNGLDKGVPAAFFVEPKAAIDLQVLYRGDSRHEKEQCKITTAVGRELLGSIWAIGVKTEAAARRAMAA